MKFIFYLLFLLSGFSFFSQTNLPNQSIDKELTPSSINKYKASFNNSKNVITTPPIGNLRTMAEWEELQAICITWTGYKSILAQIVQEAQTECEVIVLCNNSTTAQNELSNYGVSLNNVFCEVIIKL